jgi:hypothetical protein
MAAGYADTILNMEGLQHLETRRIIEAALQATDEEGQLDFTELTGRLAEQDANLLAELLATDTEGVERSHEDPAGQLRACLDELEQRHVAWQRQQLRLRVKEAEARGDLAEALRLIKEEQGKFC